MKLLHPTDFTAASDPAGRLASSLARQLHGSLTVCHVLEPQEGLPLGYLASPIAGYAMPTKQEFDFHHRTQAREGQRRADYRQQMIRRLASVAPEGARSELLTGGVVEQLDKTAGAHDLLVMGWGDTTRQLLQTVRTPLLCTSERTAVTKIERILVATDFSRAARRALPWLQRLQRHGIDLVLAHVARPEAVGPAERRLAGLAEGLKVRGVVRAGTASEELPRLAEELGADVIAIGSKGRSPFFETLLGGTGRSLLREGRHTVLNVPSKWAARDD